MAWTSLCSLDDLQEGSGKYVEIGGFQLAVFLHEGGVYALDNECPHAGGPLANGHVDNGCAVCPWHMWPFELKTGQFRGHAGLKIHTYPTRLLDREGQPALVQADLPTF